MQINDNLLFELIGKAVSQNPQTVKEAEFKLQQIEIQPGYCVHLLAIILNHSISVDARCMACVCLKNAIDKYWRKTAQNSIKEEERLMLKNQFLHYLNEPELKIARLMSVILGKLARFELPHQWPELIHKLVQTLRDTSSQNSTQSEQNLINSRCFMALHQIIKSLASKRLCNDRKVFEDLACKIIEMIIEFEYFYVQKCLNNVDTSSEMSLKEHSFYLDQAIICLKILHKLILHGFKDNVESTPVNQFIVSLWKSFESLLAKYNEIVNSKQQMLIDYFKEKYEYVIVLCVQIMCDYQETYPFNFVDTSLSDCLNIIMQICFTAQGKVVSFAKLSINLMNFLKTIIMSDKYKHRLVKIDDPLIQMRLQKAIEIKNKLFTNENLQQILGFLFNEYLLMTDDELELWSDSPEEFINEDGTATDAWKYNFRACAETLFQAFVHEYHDLVIPIVVELVQAYSKLDLSSSSSSLPVNMEVRDVTSKNEKTRALLLKDAAYNCACIAAWELVSQIDFDVWFTQVLIKEVTSQSCHAILKRRILILIANWVNIKLAPENRPPVYELLCACLQSNEDLVIRLQATLTLKAVMDDIHFEKETYLPFLNFHFGLLCQLLKEVEDSDTKIKVLSVLSFLIERVDIHIRPYCSTLADYLPFLWQESNEHNMLRCSIVTAFHHLVKSFGAQSVNYHSFLLPVIHYSTDSLNPASVYLLEDGLELWNITVQNSLQMTPDLINLFANIKPLLDRDTDIWKLCLEIIDSYVVLGPKELFQVICSSPLLSLNSLRT